MTTLPEMPYVGLVPFDESQSRYFFGRDADRNRLVANMLGNRLTLVYGPSGVGKSSVLRAGVVHSLRQQAVQNLKRLGTPKYVVVSFGTWRETPLLALRRAIQEAIAAACALETPPSDDLPDFIEQCREWTTTHRINLLLILDQFEEYFLYHPSDSDTGTIAGELVRLLNTPDLRVNVMLSLRDDALSKLDRFKGAIPALLDNRLTIEHLTRAAATDAIRKPLVQFNVDHGTMYDIEPDCVEQILNEVARGKVSLSSQGTGDTTLTTTDNDRIETPYLQLVLTTLWETEQSFGSSLLRLSTLERLGGAERIVRSHLNNTMATLDTASQDIAAQFFDRLVTTGGTKIALSLDELTSYAEAEKVQVEEVLQRLQQARLVRTVQSPSGVTQYEIYHDVLARAVVEWQKEYHQRQVDAAKESRQRQLDAEKTLRQKQLDAEATAELQKERSNAQRFRLLLGLVGVVAALATVLAFWAVTLQQEATRQAQEATKQAANARALLLRSEGEQAFTTNPLQGLRLLAEGLATSDDTNVQTQITNSLFAQLGIGRIQRWDDESRRVRNLYRFSVNSAVVLVVYEEGPSDVWNLEMGQRVETLTGNLDFVSSSDVAEFSYGLVTYDDAPGEVWNVATGEKVATPPGNPSHVYFSGIAAQPFGILYYSEGPSELWNWATGEKVVTLAGVVEDVYVKRDLTQPYVIVRYGDAPDEVWNLATGERAAVLSTNVQSIYDYNSSQPHPYVVLRYFDQPDEVWNLATGQRAATLSGITTHMYATADQPYAVVLYGSNGQSDELWNLATGERRTFFRNIVSDVFFTGAADQPYTVISFANGPAELWNMATGEQIVTLPGVVPIVHFNNEPGIRYRAITYTEGPSQLWDMAVGKQVARLPGSIDTVFLTGFEGEGLPYRVITYSDAPAELWNMATGERLARFADPIQRVFVASTLGPPFAVFSFFDAPDELWNLATAERVTRLTGAADQLFYTGAVGQPYGVLSYDNTDDEVRNWETGEFITTLPDNVSSVYFSGEDTQPFGLIDYYDSPGEVWNWATGQRVATLAGDVSNVYFRADVNNPYAILNYADAPDEIWNMATGTLIGSFNNAIANYEVYPFSFRDSASMLLVATFEDGQATLYQVDPDATTPLTPLGLGLVLSLISSTNGRYMVTPYSDGRAYRLDLQLLEMLPTLQAQSPEELQGWLCTYIQATAEKAGMPMAQLDAVVVPFLPEGETPKSCR